MPELPEVETLKRELSRVLVGKKIKKFESEKFKLDLAGEKIIGISRRAKILIFKLQPSNSNLLVHLKMTGQLVYSPSPSGRGQGGGAIIGGHPADPTKHTHAIFHFTDGSRLLFNDLRKFGWLKIVDDTKLTQLSEQAGVEPLSREFTLEKFAEIIRRYPKRRIKQLLLDQTLIAGLGNIYTDESCFLARVLPTRLSGTLTTREQAALHQAIIKILKLAISKKGTSSRNYVRSSGQPGGFVPHLNVYGRGQEKCKRCGGKISKIKLNGRGTHYCPNCQK